MAILNYTTTIAADKTIGEIQKIISSKGATKIMIDYEGGLPTHLSFAIEHNGQPLSFRLPANWQGVLKAMKAQRVAKTYQNEAQALRVCWRIIKDWVAAQMAIVEAEQASLATIFLPYAVMGNGNTVAHNILETSEGQKLLNP